jgi:hypothetical protein
VTVRAAFAFAFVIGFALVGAGCSSGRASSNRGTHVYLFGDSLVFQAQEQFQAVMDKHGGYDVEVAGQAGSATCDWWQNMTTARDQFQPKIVAMSFSGNALGPCMKHADGTPLTDREYVDKYTADTRRAIATFGPNVAFYLVGTPVNGQGDDRVWQIYRRLAPHYPNVHFVDGGIYVTPNHKFALTLPCLPGEKVCDGPVVNGVHYNVVRSPDHAHFCPVDPGFGKPCKIYSSGAYRFALAIAQAIERGPQ